MKIEGSLFFSVTIAKSKIHGKGLYTSESIPAKRKIGSLAGEIISRKTARKKAKNRVRISVVELRNGKALDASVYSNQLRYVNHSCRPNTYMRTLGNHVEFYALRSIKTDEELTCNYAPTHHEGENACAVRPPAGDSCNLLLFIGP